MDTSLGHGFLSLNLPVSVSGCLVETRESKERSLLLRMCENTMLYPSIYGDSSNMHSLTHEKKKKSCGQSLVKYVFLYVVNDV